MVEHISSERLASLLDDGVEDGAARDHLDGCPSCRRELDLLRRMRMALSAMDDLDPPTGQWDRIQAELSGPEPAPADEAAEATDPGGPRRTGGRHEGPTGIGAWVRDIGWLRAAAGIVLFAGGLGLGSLLGPLPGSGGGSSPAGPTEAAGASGDPAAMAAPTGETAGAAATPTASGADAAGDASGRDRDEILRQLEVLGSGELDAREVYRNPTAAAERLARLDALVRAAREALEEEPADPAMNQFLFRVVEERQQLNQALHMASIDVR